MTRFTATVKWNDEWFSNLKPLEKLVFIYLTDRCDNAGFFEINKRIDAFLIGITQEEFIETLGVIKKCFIPSNDKKKLWLKNYIKYQKNLPLNPDNNAHKQILLLLQSNYENFEYDFNKLGAKEGLISPIGNILGKGNSKGKGKEGGMGETKMEEKLWQSVVKDFYNSYEWKEKFCRDKNILMPMLEKEMKEFISNMELRENYKPLTELKDHFVNTWNKNIKYGLNSIKGSSQPNGSALSGTSVIAADKEYKGRLGH